MAVIVGLTEPSTFQSTPPARGATKRPLMSSSRSVFQSTPPARGATVIAFRIPSTIWDFNPRPPQGERPCPFCGGEADFIISIHAPRKGSDSRVPYISELLPYFNPRPPQGERPPHMELAFLLRYFNPRPPQGERPIISGNAPTRDVFQSTPPARGATSRSQTVRTVKMDFNPRPPQGERRT